MVKPSVSDLTVEIVDDPEYNRQARAGDEQFNRNVAWLESHWFELLPAARGRFVAVANQQTCVASTLDEAWAWINANHPDDQGPLVQYVPTDTRPRVYAHQR